MKPLAARSLWWQVPHAVPGAADEYGVNDADGTRPHFVRWLRENQPAVAAGWKKLDDVFYSYWGPMPYQMPDQTT